MKTLILASAVIMLGLTTAAQATQYQWNGPHGKGTMSSVIMASVRNANGASVTLLALLKRM